MAYDFFPKSVSDITLQLEKNNWDIQKISEVVTLFSYLKKTYPKLETPINLDKNTSVINISRSLSEDVKLPTISSNLKFNKIKLKFGNGSSGNRGANNRGNLFEPEFADAFIDWWNGKTISNKQILSAIEHIYESYDLKEVYEIEVDVVGGENTRRPLTFNGKKIILNNPKGTGFNVGPSVTDITLNPKGKKPIFLSLKLGTTTTFFNVGVKTILTTEEIKNRTIKNQNGLLLLKTFGIDPVLFCDVFNGKKIPSTRKIDRNPSYNKSSIESLLQSGIGHGYHIVHKMSNKIISKKMDEAAMKKAAQINGSFVVYYGGKTGSGKRIDVEFKSSTYAFKINLRDTQGGSGYPTRMMCDFSYI
jgi:hypothetical protein